MKTANTMKEARALVQKDLGICDYISCSEENETHCRFDIVIYDECDDSESYHYVNIKKDTK